MEIFTNCIASDILGVKMHWSETETMRSISQFTELQIVNRAGYNI